MMIYPVKMVIAHRLNYQRPKFGPHPTMAPVACVVPTITHPDQLPFLGVATNAAKPGGSLYP